MFSDKESEPIVLEVPKRMVIIGSMFIEICNQLLCLGGIFTKKCSSLYEISRDLGRMPRGVIVLATMVGSS